MKFTLKFIPKYKIDQVIDKIAQYLNIESIRITLYHNDVKLCNNLTDISLHDGSAIKVVIEEIQQGSFKIKIIMWTSKEVILYVNPKDTLKDLALKLSDKEKITINSRFMIYKGKLLSLNDDSTIEENGIIENSCLHLLRTMDM